MNQEVDASLGRPHTPERTMSTVREDVDHDTHEIYSPDLFVTPPPSTSVMAPLLSSPPRHGASEDFTGQLPTVCYLLETFGRDIHLNHTGRQE